MTFAVNKYAVMIYLNDQVDYIIYFISDCVFTIYCSSIILILLDPIYFIDWKLLVALGKAHKILYIIWLNTCLLII